MAWTSPVDQTTGHLVTATEYNQQIIDNLKFLHGEAPDGRVGYQTGIGGSVTQTTSRSTGVTLNTICGKITTDSTSLASGGSAQFIVTNSTVSQNDVILVCNAGSAIVIPNTAVINNGSFTINYYNNSGGSIGSACVFNFAVIKSATS